jgi:hypothetical protein
MRPQTFTDVPSTRKPLSLRLRLQAGADEPRPNVGKIQKNHPNQAQPRANSSKRCIKRANCQAPRLDHWCLGSWLDVDTGLNSENDVGKGHFAASRGEDAD